MPRQTADAALQEAWTETASRLGLVRLGWWPDSSMGEPALAFPGVRDVERSFEHPWRLQPSQSERRSRCGAEDERCVTVAGGYLAAAGPSGRLPSRAALLEVATLAAALYQRRALLNTGRQAERRLRQARATAAAGHDLRNELTRALLLTARGAEGDASEIRRALGAARDLAQSALLGPGDTDHDRASGASSIEASPGLHPLDLKSAIVDEVRAAAEAARCPSGFVPSLRLKCPPRLQVLAHESTFRRALRNLVINAIEATARRQTSSAATGPASEPAGVRVVANRLPEPTTSGFSVQLSVEDDGVGMTTEGVSSFLDPKSRREGLAASSTAPESTPASTGLGTASLALALEAGAIPMRVESGLGKGTSIRLSLRESMPTEGLPALVVDRDVRRCRRRVANLRQSGKRAWGVTTNGLQRTLSELR